MEIHIEHHGWRWNNKQGWWGNTIHKTFKNKKSFEKYIGRVKEERPHSEITYFVYASKDGEPDAPIAHVIYTGRQYEINVFSPLWVEFMK